MNSRLKSCTLSSLLFLATVALSLGGMSRLRAAEKPPTPKPPTPPPAEARPTPARVEPVTGLPVPPPSPDAWKDPNWQDPDKVLDVSYDALPVSAVAEHLLKEFKQAFDVLIPTTWTRQGNPAFSVDPSAATIRLQLKHVKASEVFQAMNLMFEAENAPYRWELKVNGTRSTAVLRVRWELLPDPEPPPRVTPTTRMVYFVGDLLDVGMTMERLVGTVSEVYQMSFGPPKGVLQFHQDAQLLIVTGTADQIGFVQQTLSALRGKFAADRKRHLRPGEPMPIPGGTEPRAE